MRMSLFHHRPQFRNSYLKTIKLKSRIYWTQIKKISEKTRLGSNGHSTYRSMYMFVQYAGKSVVVIFNYNLIDPIGKIF
jgi:hypothetical protein